MHEGLHVYSPMVAVCAVKTRQDKISCLRKSALMSSVFHKLAGDILLVHLRTPVFSAYTASTEIWR